VAKENNSTLLIKKSKTGHLVPVVNSKNIHSINNPIREAEVWASNFIGCAKDKNHFLILGLGFGYHISEFVKLASLKQKNIKILVLEANQELIESFFKYCENMDWIQVEVLTTDTEIKNKNILRFLANGPAILAHMPSFESSPKIFQNFLRSKATQEISFYEDWQKNITNKNLTELKNSFMNVIGKKNERKYIADKSI
jgi:hypothetical protein